MLREESGKRGVDYVYENMTGYTSTSIPKPKNWQDFERHSCTLFRCILRDPHTSTHGRGGQAQDGVDIYGRRDKRDDQWVGVQCKLKGETEEVSEKERGNPHHARDFQTEEMIDAR